MGECPGERSVRVVKLFYYSKKMLSRYISEDFPDQTVT